MVWREAMASWLAATGIRILNVAGPPRIEGAGGRGFVREVLKEARRVAGQQRLREH